jgi:signal transduction histidine kinase/ActR/RegA family two-component response regulator
MYHDLINLIQERLNAFVKSNACVIAGVDLRLPFDSISIVAINDDTEQDDQSHVIRREIDHLGFFWYQSNSSLELDQEVVSSMIDVIESRVEVKILEDKVHIMQSILDELPEMIAVKNLNQEYVIANKKANALFQSKFETIVGRTVTELYGEQEKNRVVGFDLETLSNRKPIQKELLMKGPNGMFEAEALRMPAYLEDQQLVGIISINRSIEEKKHIQNQLMNSLSFQDTLIKIAMQFINVHEEEADQAIQDALAMAGERMKADRVYVFDYDFVAGTTSNTYEWCAEGVTPEIEHLQHYPIADIEDLWLKYHRQHEMVYIEDLDSIDHQEVIYQYLAPQGIKSILTIPLFHNDQLIGFAGFDATKEIRHWSEEDRKLLQMLAELIVNLKVKIMFSQELILQRQKAEQFSKLKSQFITNMSHEIRTPLSGIYSAINLLLGTQFSPQQIEYLELAKLSIETLSSILNDILDISQIEQGKLKMDIHDICLEQEMFQIAKLEELLVTQKGLRFDYDFDYRIRHEVEFDRIRLRQIIINLTHNSIKYTDQGFISIGVHLEQEDNDHYWIRYIVEDTGSGIPEASLPYILEPFYQADQSSTKMYQGTGLGLSIVKEILSYFNAQIEIESNVTTGTKISFVLKMKKGKLLFSHHPLINKEIIIVQSDSMPNDIGISFYKSMGFQAICIPASDVLNMTNKQYDVVVFEMDLTHISKEWLNQVISLTSGNQTKLVCCNLIGINYPDDELKKLGIDLILNFPLTRAKVLEMLTHNLSSPFEIEEAMTKHSLFNFEPILIVDDNPINLQALSSILESENLSVDKANSGDKAIEMIKNKTYSLVFMDIQMPKMDGYETVRIIRSLGYTSAQLPIIAVSANVSGQSELLAHEAGMDGYIKKPYKIHELMDTIQKHFDQKTCEREIINMSTDAMPFNSEYLMMLFKNKAYLGEKVISAFFEEYGSNVRDLRQAFEIQDFAKVSQIAHYLKGSAAYAAAERIVWLCDEIMRRAKSDQRNSIKQLIERIDPEVHEWISSVNAWQKEMNA